MAVYSAFLAVTALCIGKAIVIMAKFFARRRFRPGGERSGSTGKISTPWKSTCPSDRRSAFLFDRTSGIGPAGGPGAKEKDQDKTEGQPARETGGPAHGEVRPRTGPGKGRAGLNRR